THRDVQSYADRVVGRTGRLVLASLTIDSGSMIGSCRTIGRDVLVLGREKACDIVFQDDTVSRKHARIVRGAEGYSLEDLQSRNGTFLNGRRVTAPTRLRDGDTIHLYDVALTFNEEAHARQRSLTGSGSIWLTGEAANPG